MNMELTDKFSCNILKSSQSLRILIIEAYTDANVGSCALVENSLKILKSKFKDSQIKIMAHDPESFAGLYNKLSIKDIFHYPFKQTRLKQVIWLLKTIYWMSGTLIISKLLTHKYLNKKNWYPFQNKIKSFIWADLVVSVGAERINDKYFKNIIFSLFTYCLVKSFKKKMVIFPSTIGPFLFGWSKTVTKKTLNKVDLIYTRDNLSNQITCNLLSPGKKKIINSSDVAVLQEPIKKEDALEMIAAGNKERLVGISAMQWSYFKNRIETPYSNYGAYIKEMAITADTLINKYNVTIIFYPTNFPVHGCRENDITTADDIHSLIKNKKKIKIINKLSTPAQLQGMLSCSQVNITTRMHACILSTSAYVPTISINYLFKVSEYMQSLGLSDFSIDIEEFYAEKALKMFDEIWLERKKWRIHIEKAIIQKRLLLWESMDALDALVSK